MHGKIGVRVRADNRGRIDLVPAKTYSHFSCAFDHVDSWSGCGLRYR